MPQVEVTPKVLTFDANTRVQEVTVHTLSVVGLSEVRLAHILQDSSCFCLSGYVLDPSSVACYSAGKDDQGQLAHVVSVERYTATHVHSSLYPPNVNLLKDPTPREIQLDQPVDTNWKNIAAGDNHGLALTTRGDVYTWGTGFYGELGLTSRALDECQTRLLNSKKAGTPTVETKRYNFSDKSHEDYKALLEDYSYGSLQVPMLAAAHRLDNIQPISQVACGLFHSLLLSSSNTVYAFGLGQNGRLGLGSEKNSCTPEVVTALKGVSVAEIAAGYHCSFFLTTQATLLSCGCAGVSGHPTDTVQPSQVSFVSEVHSVSSALNHSGVVTSSGRVVLFGDNTHGKVCGPSPYFLDPALIGGRRARAVYCGAKYTMFLTEDLEVYAVGSNDNGQLGLSSTNFHSVNQPIHVDFLSGRGICELALGQEHSAGITVNGMLYSWGSNKKGQLGIGTMAKEFKRVGLPRLCDAFLGSPVTSVKATRNCTFFLTAATHPESNTSMFAQWKRSLILEEKIIQERANYRYTLLKRDIDRQDLVKRIHDERELALVSTRSPSALPKSAGKLAQGDYYSFWRLDNETEDKPDGRVVSKFKRPSHCADRQSCVVTVFPIKHRPQPLSSRSGSPFNITTGKVKLRPAVLETRPGQQAKFRYMPSLMTSNLFHPYELELDPMLVEPSRRA
jgi:alpha-tubulin suppressor-like RCC1 family protein